MTDSKKKQMYIIAEVGQNHNGDINIAKQLIDVAAMSVIDHFTGQKLPGVNAMASGAKSRAPSMPAGSNRSSSLGRSLR